MNMKLCFLALWVALLPLAIHASEESSNPDETDPVIADPSGPAPGHSSHGEVFNEGPRQGAYRIEGVGDVHFPVTTDSADAQAFINQGVAQLHGFWYFEAERSFRQAADIDPQCAMAYWGAALANLGNEKRARGFIAEAVKRKTAVTERETLYIDALAALLASDNKKQDKKSRLRAYAQGLEELLYKYPDDVEAKAFLALQLWKNSSEGIPIESHLAVDALLEQVFAASPMHPAHHYRIHLWDRRRAEKALHAAAMCGPAAPGIAHMWHMPGHIYSRLKRYADAAWQQEASARVDHAHMMRDRILPDQIHNFAHNNEWLIRNLNHVGRVHDAIDLAKNMIELPRHPKYNTSSKRGSGYYGRLRLIETLRRYELWDELLTLDTATYLADDRRPAERIQRVRYLGEAHFRSHDLAGGQAQLAELSKALAEETAKLAVAEAEALNEAREKELNEAATEKAKKAAVRPHRQQIESIEKAFKELEVLQAFAQADYQEAWQGAKQVQGIEKTFAAHLQLLAGETGEAIEAARKEVAAHENEVQPLAALVELLWYAGEREEAAKSFKRLRVVAAYADLEVPPLVRLRPVARHLGLPEDWRLPSSASDDLGPRPPLAQLGPFRWHPRPAPEWTLRDASGQTHSLAEYRGRPLLVVFYLGYGCLHCAEQLQALTQMAEQFSDGGINLTAISTDSLDELHRSLRNYGDHELPIQLLADPEFNVFRAYRAYDDFEQQPLHATFLLDGRGLVRWQDISHEPFMEVDFLLKEAHRLLSQPSTDSESFAAAPAGD